MLGHCLFPALILDSATSLRTLDASIEETGRKQEQVARGLQPAVRTGDDLYIGCRQMLKVAVCVFAELT